MTIREKLGLMLLKGNHPLQQAPAVKQMLPDGKFWSWYINHGWGHSLPAKSSTYIDQGYASNSDVYAIISYSLKAAAGIKWVASEWRGDEEIPLPETHPVCKLLKYASPVQSFSELVQAWLGYKLLLGNSYIYFLKPDAGVNSGKPVQMTILPASLMEVIPNRDTGEVISYRFNNAVTLPAEDVSHAKNWNPQMNKDGTLYGLSPLSAGLRLLNMSNNGYDAQAASIANGGVKGLLSGEAEDDWSKPETERIQSAFDRDVMGVSNYGKIVVTSAKMNWSQIGVSPADLELMDALRLTKQQLCSLYGFPSQLLNDKEGSLYNTYKEAKKVFYTDMLIPELKLLEGILTRYVAEVYGDNIYIHMDTSAIDVLMDNKVEQAQWLALAWWVKGIDKQRIMGLPEDTELDKYFMPAGIMPLDELTGLNGEVMSFDPLKRK